MVEPATNNSSNETNTNEVANALQEVANRVPKPISAPKLEAVDISLADTAPDKVPNAPANPASDYSARGVLHA